MVDYESYFNGEWLPHNQIKLGLDTCFGTGHWIFDIARTFNGVPFLLDRHIARLYRGIKYLRLDAGLTAEEMTQLSVEAVRRNEHRRAEVGDFTINQFIGGTIAPDGPAMVSVHVKPVNFPKFAQYYDEGVHGVIARTRSYSSDSLDPKVKHRSRLNFRLAALEVHDVDPDALPILLDYDGNVTEGIGYNVFLVKDGVIKTPTGHSILQGISRSSIIDLADQLQIPLVEENLQPYDLYTADEVFFTRTSPRIMPVSMVDHRPVFHEVPGPITTQLVAALSEMVGVDIVEQARHFAGLKG